MSLFTYWLKHLIYICCLHRALCLCREKMNGPQKKTLEQKHASSRNLCSHERLLASLSLHCPWIHASNTVERQLRQNLFAMIRQVWLLRKIKPRMDLETLSWECSIVLQCFRSTFAMLRPGIQLYFYILLDTVLSGECVAKKTSAYFPLCYHAPAQWCPALWQMALKFWDRRFTTSSKETLRAASASNLSTVIGGNSLL